MANKGPRKHLKRLPAPKNWQISRKTNKYTTRPSAGPHSIGSSLPLLLVLRDLLGYADNAREAKKVIKMGKVLVDGVKRKDHRYPTGLMDVISLPDANESFLVVLDEKGRVKLNKIEDNTTKLCKIENKTVIKGGHIQLNLHDGRNQIVKLADATKAEEDIYKTGDCIIISIPEQGIIGHVQFGEGKLAYITGGKHVGDFAKIIDIEKKQLYPDIITLETENGEQFKTIRDYVFVVGDDKPVISMQ